MLARADPRRLREEAGIRQVTVAVALGVPRNYIGDWEAGAHLFQSPEGFAWARFTAGLERHAQVTAEIEAEEREAA